jgi:uncharacterized protein DUF3306
MADPDDDQGFLSRWSRRKTQARLATTVAESPQPEARPVEQVSEAGSSQPAPEVSPAAVTSDPAPTLADVAQLRPESDFSRFVTSGVRTDVKNAALKKLFSDPRFNVMDGLDVYIDDYSVPDPVPSSVLRKMAQAKFLGLLTEAAKEERAPSPDPSKHRCEVAPTRAECDARPEDRIATHENADLQLQPDDAAGRLGAAPGSGDDPGRQH